MLTDRDIIKITKATIEAGKEVFVTKRDFLEFGNEIKSEFNKLQASVDRFAITVHRHDQEITIINHRLTKLENPTS